MNMMDEYLLMERIKERLCYVARDVRSELAAAAAPRDANANRIAKEYVLPDGVSILRGYVKGDDPGEGAFGGGGNGGAAAAKKAAAAAGGAPAEQARASTLAHCASACARLTSLPPGPFSRTILPHIPYSCCRCAMSGLWCPRRCCIRPTSARRKRGSRNAPPPPWPPAAQTSAACSGQTSSSWVRRKRR